MYEYKVLHLSVNDCEDAFNQHAREGWRVISVVSNAGMGAGVGVIATLERKAD